MNSCACAARAAASISSLVECGRPKAMFSRTVARKRYTSWKDDRYMFKELLVGQLPNVDASNTDYAFGRVPETRNEVQHGALSGSGRANDCRGRPGLCHERNVPQDRCRVIAEGDLIEFHVMALRLETWLLRRMLLLEVHDSADSLKSGVS